MLQKKLYFYPKIQYDTFTKYKKGGFAVMEEQNQNITQPETMDIPPEAEVVSPTPQPRRKRTFLYWGLLAVFACVFLVSAGYLINYGINSYQQQQDYGKLQDIVASIQAEQNKFTDATQPTQSDDSTPTQGEDATVPSSGDRDILPEYADLYAMNSDMVGWIKFDGTRINYPVLQSSVDNKDYYLYRDFNKYSRNCGSIYIRETCDLFAPSDNVTIYGHHMTDMTMFTDLDYYKDKSYWEAHQTFTLDTLYEHRTYQIIAVFKTSANLGAGLAYHRFENADSAEEFQSFLEQIHAIQMYDTGLTAEYGDKLVCLSTCEYTLNNGRFVVVGKWIQ